MYPKRNQSSEQIIKVVEHIFMLKFMFALFFVPVRSSFIGSIPFCVCSLLTLLFYIDIFVEFA